MIDLDKLSTEKNNIESKDIELKSTIEILEKINSEEKLVAFAVEKEIPNISKLIDAIEKITNDKTRIIYIGAGTSGRLGVLDASECPPTFGVDYEVVKAIMAGGNNAMFKAKENVEDSMIQGEIDLKKLNITKSDIVIGITASGRTPYVIGALEYANSLGVITGSISCSKNSEVSKISKYPIEVVVGAEIVTGSTRMKAGTAQKMVLNMISTTVMIKRGKVFSGYMVDVKTSNTKLIERAKNIIMKTTNVDYEKASRYLKESNMNVKVAIAMIILGIDENVAKLKLAEYKNNVARLIHEYSNKIKRK